MHFISQLLFGRNANSPVNRLKQAFLPEALLIKCIKFAWRKKTYPFLFPFSSQYFLLLTDIDRFFIHIFLRPQTKKKNAFTNKLLIGK